MASAPEIWNYHPISLRLMRTAEPIYADADPEVEDHFLFPGNTTAAKPGKDRQGKEQVLDLALQKWSYVDAPSSANDKAPEAAGPSAQELAAAAVELRAPLLRRAVAEVERLQALADLSAATDEELVQLQAWQAYLVSLCRIEKQPNFPSFVDWPQIPGAEDDSGATEIQAQA